MFPHITYSILNSRNQEKEFIIGYICILEEVVVERINVLQRQLYLIYTFKIIKLLLL